ncbi:tRNA lysidine(34) synthetase, partial [Marivita sp.]|uniref:tRNA lysidine(34) synthetase n=1 Tax=Marivita sp. TaxID=2003365 RepID=UPI003F6B6CD3
DGVGNTQDAARRARLSLIDQWRGDLRHVLFAHTRDDQAETVLMRLARGSGVDGLAGMRRQRDVTPHAVWVPALDKAQLSGAAPPRQNMTPGFSVLRPCLDMTRDELRHYLKVLQGPWVDDPTNENREYDRVRIRHLLKLLGEEGITASVLTETAKRLARARDGLTLRLADVAGRLCSDAPLGQVWIERDGFAVLDEETQLRMLTAALCYVASAEYRPRAASSEGLLEQVLSGRGGTLHGAEVIIEKAHLRVVREERAVSATVADQGELWDGQWVLTDLHGPLREGAVVRALGDDGWQQIPDRSGITVPFRAARSLPALWSSGSLLACPGVGFGPEVAATRYVLGRVDTGFEAFCLSH